MSNVTFIRVGWMDQQTLALMGYGLFSSIRAARQHIEALYNSEIEPCFAEGIYPIEGGPIRSSKITFRAEAVSFPSDSVLIDLPVQGDDSIFVGLDFPGEWKDLPLWDIVRLAPVLRTYRVKYRRDPDHFRQHALIERHNNVINAAARFGAKREMTARQSPPPQPITPAAAPAVPPNHVKKLAKD